MEKIKFKIVLDSDYQTTAPHAEVLVNDTVIFDARVTGKSYITYTKEFDNEGNHKLIVKLKNKQPEDTEVDSQGNIVKDSLLKIDKVIIEDIEIHNNFSLNTGSLIYLVFFSENINLTIKYTIPIATMPDNAPGSLTDHSESPNK